MENKEIVMGWENIYHSCVKCGRTLQDYWKYCPFCREMVTDKGDVEVANSVPQKSVQEGCGKKVYLNGPSNTPITCSKDWLCPECQEVAKGEENGR